MTAIILAVMLGLPAHEVATIVVMVVGVYSALALTYFITK